MHTDRERESFTGLLLRYRARTGLTQRELAQRVGVSMRTVQGWETGLIYPTTQRLQALVEALLDAGAFGKDHEQTEAQRLWDALTSEASRARAPFDREWYADLLARRASVPAGAEQGQLSPAPLPQVAAPERAPAPIGPVGAASPQRHDWGDAPSVTNFVGRVAELTQARDWLLHDNCHLLS